MSLTPDDIDHIRKLRYEDGLSTWKTAELIGCSQHTVCRYAPGYIGKVDNTRLREAFEASGLSAHAVAKRLGWEHRRINSVGGKYDASRLRRTLGLQVDVTRGRRRYRKFIDAETAHQIAEAMGLAPWEVGL